jgi:hypothetical protein
MSMADDVQNLTYSQEALLAELKVFNANINTLNVNVTKLIVLLTPKAVGIDVKHGSPVTNKE